MTPHAHDNVELQKLAEAIVSEAAELIRNRRAELLEQAAISQFAMTKSSPVDPVTIVDTAAEDFIAQRLAQLRPEDGIIGEEGSGQHGRSSVTWIVDPIDGTVNFIYGIPMFAVSLAAAIDGRVVAGAVINVTNGELYSAARGHGAVLKAGEQCRRLEVNGITDLEQTLLATGFAYDARRRAVQGELVAQLLPRVRDIRRLGSAALDLCHVAAGRVDAYYEHGINCWDYAAGALIAEEAGARVRTPALSVPGSEGAVVLAAAPEVFDDVAELLDRTGSLGNIRS
ncbi:inositol monophosphatase family protein [Corynebacterium tapiri]|uniref:Inositol-1-monophosphatase n=1 Tax=Corynebacterium tapiri TaxID=1448266 RepID=A0A5C4U4W4_9CORY|nr:inositol monophosphatase family protein [Corynebacterium tapiri]TNL99196.1 inositol monophosphatase [Corynebacterium tapiri]